MPTLGDRIRELDRTLYAGRVSAARQALNDLAGAADAMERNQAAFCRCGDACNREGSACPVCRDAMERERDVLRLKAEQRDFAVDAHTRAVEDYLVLLAERDELARVISTLADTEPVRRAAAMDDPGRVPCFITTEIAQELCRLAAKYAERGEG